MTKLTLMFGGEARKIRNLPHVNMFVRPCSMALSQLSVWRVPDGAA
jgi:hypothetical protein